MRPDAWRKLKGFSRAKLAEMMSTTEVTVFRHETGLRLPPPPAQVRYSEITEGAVTPADWVELWSDPAAVKARAEETETRMKRKAAAA